MEYVSNTDSLNLDTLSTTYKIKKISEEDISDVYNLCKANTKYYEYAKTEPTKRNLTEVISQLPEGTGPENKYFVGFYDNDKLIAILDLITKYPNVDNAFIGWFMVDVHLQRKGIGSELFADIRSSLKAQGYNHLRLGVIKNNVEAINFWTKQGFKYTGITNKQEEYNVLVMSRDI